MALQPSLLSSSHPAHFNCPVSTCILPLALLFSYPHARRVAILLLTHLQSAISPPAYTSLSTANTVQIFPAPLKNWVQTSLRAARVFQLLIQSLSLHIPRPERTALEIRNLCPPTLARPGVSHQDLPKTQLDSYTTFAQSKRLQQSVGVEEVVSRS